MLYKNPLKRRTERRRAIGWVVLCLAIAIAVGFGGYCIRNVIVGDIKTQAATSMKNTILDRAVQCYAVEGAYPESLAYIEENYGLQINHSDYYVTYEVFATNVLPQVQVLEKQ